MNKRKDINQMNLDEFIDYLRGKSTPEKDSKTKNLRLDEQKHN